MPSLSLLLRSKRKSMLLHNRTERKKKNPIMPSQERRLLSQYAVFFSFLYKVSTQIEKEKSSSTNIFLLRRKKKPCPLFGQWVQWSYKNTALILSQHGIFYQRIMRGMKTIIFDDCKNINYEKVLFENFLINKNFKIKTDHHTYLFSIIAVKEKISCILVFYL